MSENILIIGYGNTLRSDDGAGQKVAEAFLEHPQIRAIAVHQLTPELVEELRQAKTVYFVDAAPVEKVAIQPIKSQDNEATFGHFIDPQSLLGLTKQLYDYSPQAFWVLIPAQNFDLGETFSPVTKAAISEAIQLLEAEFSMVLSS